MKNVATAIALLIWWSCLSGCMTGSYMIKNVGTTTLYSVNVGSGGLEHGHGTVSPNTVSSYMGRMRIKAGQPVQVSWKTEQSGTFLRQTVVVRRLPAPDEDLVFEINGAALNTYNKKR
jgi:hypothetical protein